MPAYREKDNLIHRLHPMTSVTYVLVVFLLSLIFSHPAYLLGLFAAVGAVIVAGDNFPQWKGYLKFSMVMIILITMINALFSGAGSTVLISGPNLPVLGKTKMTLEALAYGGGMGLRLLVIISIFCFYTYSIHPDKVLKLLSRRGNKSVFAITLATRLFPLMVRDFKRIREVQRCRGVKLDTGKWWQRARNYFPIISVLLLSCLERSLQLAESMQARGYGSGTRTYYSRELWHPRDYVILCALLIGMIMGLGAVFKGWSAYHYYPRLEKFNLGEITMAGALLLVLSLPAILSWGWKKWPLLRSKI
ncbi:MAG: energy-coupling factor transporter transmembrane component T family protein [Bacillota bacterium]|jgi:energy-coupling factor transport system permease protein